MRAYKLAVKLGLYCLISLLVGPVNLLAQGESLPNWILNPKYFSASEDALYGVGSGYNLESAKKNALADLASFLFVTVASQSQTDERIVRGGSIESESNFSQKVTTSSAPILLTGVEYDRSLQLAGRYYLRAAVPAKSLARKLVEKTTASNQAVASAIARLPKQLQLKDLVDLAELNPGQQEASIALLMLESLMAIDPIYFINPLELAGLREEFDLRQESYQQKIASSLLAINITNRELAPLVPVVEELAQKSGVRTIDQVTSGQTGVLTIAGKISASNFHGAHLVRASLELSLIDENEVTLKTKTYRLRGISAVSIDDATKKAGLSWQENFENKNLIADIAGN